MTTHTYDAMDRVATRNDPVGAGESFGYDGMNNLTRHTDRKGQVATLSYDPLNRRVGGSYVDATTGFVYGGGGRLVQATDSVGGSVVNQYDALDRLVAQTTSLGTISYQYDGLGRRMTMAAPGQGSITYGYDAASRLTSITHASQLVQFQYDLAGRRARLTLPNQASTEYQYDAASRLTALIYRNAGGVLGDLGYQYDVVGNRIAVDGAFARTLLPDPVASASYDAANRQHAWNGLTLTYDANGNLTTDTTRTYTWDARDRLAALSGSGTTAVFGYDPLGRRRHKTIGGTESSFHHDGLNPVQILSGIGGATDILTGLGIDEFFVSTGAGDHRTLLTDALGSTVAELDPATAVVAEYTYAPFGQTSATGAPGSPFQYTRRENDGTGLYYYRARYYHPQLQRFVAEDPIGFAGGDFNLYAYVRNNPLGYSDPRGEWLCKMNLPGLGDALVDDSIANAIADFYGRNYFSGVPTTFTSAFRSSARQRNIMSPYQKAAPGTSLHEAGFAIDLDWSAIQAANQESTALANAMAAGLDWGGNFEQPDPVHFYREVPGGPENRPFYINRAQQQRSKSAGDIPHCL